MAYGCPAGTITAWMYEHTFIFINTYIVPIKSWVGVGYEYRLLPWIYPYLFIYTDMWT
jgi:hypothetical protein